MLYRLALLFLAFFMFLEQILGCFQAFVTDFGFIIISVIYNFCISISIWYLILYCMVINTLVVHYTHHALMILVGCFVLRQVVVLYCSESRSK